MPSATVLPTHPNFKNRTGQRFGRLTVIAYAGRLNGAHAWQCRCDCGQEKTAEAGELHRGHVTSCGCRRSELAASRFFTHGRTKFPLHKIWTSMVARCHSPTDGAYRYYGARGIAVCDRWRESFETFAGDMGERPRGRSLDRIDNDKGYSPENCRWATRKVQGRNRRGVHLLTINGETLPMSAWAERCGVDYFVLRARIRRGWPALDALSRPVRKLRR